MQGRGQGVLGDPAVAGGLAGVGLRGRVAQRVLDTGQGSEAFVPAALDVLLGRGVARVAPEVAEPAREVPAAVLVRVGTQLPDQAHRLRSLRQQVHRAGGQVGRGERGRMAVGEGGLQLGGAGALFVAQPGDESDRRDPHIGAAALGAGLAGLLPGPVAVEQTAGGHAGAAGGPVVVGRVVPVDELLAHRAGQPERGEQPAVHGGADATPQGQCHLGVVGDVRGLRQPHRAPRPALGEDRRHVVELGREAQGVAEREPGQRAGGGLLGEGPGRDHVLLPSGLSSGGCRAVAAPAR